MQIPKEATRVFKGIIFDVYHWEQELPDGTTATFEMAKRKPTIRVLPIIDGKIMMVHETQPVYGTFVGTITGRSEEGESPEVAAKRELLEEAGLSCDLEYWFTYNTPIGKVDWPIITFIGRNAKKVAEPNLQDGEQIETFLVTVDEFIKKIQEKEFLGPELVEKVLSDVEGFRKLIE